MKLIKSICLIGIVFMSIKSKSQSFCGTESNIPDYLANVQSQFTGNLGPYTIRIYVHFIRYTDGTGGMTTAEFNTALQLLSDDLAPYNICISLKGTENINNSTYYNSNMFDATYFATITGTNNQSDAIDIYFHPNSSPNAGGKAGSIPSSNLVIGGTWTNGPIVNTSHILTHEFGHCLGLFHTHHQLEAGCSDCADGTNCTTCGDFVCDTPPDPNLAFNATCNYTGGGTDICGLPFNPNETLIMSYTHPYCMQNLTVDQGQRMRDFIANTPILQAATVPDNVYIQNITFNLSNPVLYAASKSVTAGENVINTPIGPVLFSNGSRGELKARNYISLEVGFQANPTSTGSFYAWIDPSFCSVFTNNNARMAMESSYKPFLNNSKWLTTVQGFEGQLNDNYIQNGDTTLNGLLYKLIDKTNIILPSIYNDPFLNPNYTFFRHQTLREDVSSRKVYKIGSNGEVLLYDFSLTVGDTHPSNSSYTVITLDSVVTADGYNNRLIFSNTVDSIIWIEGVGNIAAPFQNDLPYNQNWLTQLICNYQNNSLVYDNGNSVPINCDFYVSLNANNAIEAGKVSIIPNPSTGSFTVNLPRDFNIKSVVIRDLGGRIVKNLSYLKYDNSKIQIEASDLLSGIYFVDLISPSQKITSKVSIQK